MTPRQVALGADVFTGLVAVSVAAALGNLVWDAIRPPREPHAIVTRSRPAVPAEADISPIVRLAPFGDAAPAADPDTGQALVLRGILLASPAALSTALIADAQGHVLAYRIGQALPNGATLSAIARDTVTLDAAGSATRLGFVRTAGGGGEAGNEPSAGQSAADDVILVGSDEPPPAPSPPPPGPQPTKAGSPPLSGAAAIRALIPPSVAGIPPEAPAPPPPSPPR